MQDSAAYVPLIDSAVATESGSVSGAFAPTSIPMPTPASRVPAAAAGDNTSPRGVAVAVVGSLNTNPRDASGGERVVTISVRADAEVSAADSADSALQQSRPKRVGADPFQSHKSTASRASRKSQRSQRSHKADAQAKGRSRCTWCCCGFVFLVLAAVCCVLFAASMLRAAAQHNLHNIVGLLETNAFNHSAADGTYSVIVDPATSKRYDLHDVEKTLLGTIYVRLCARDITLMRQVLCGANIVVQNDKAFYYKLFSSLKDAYRRISSHHSIVPQYGVPEGHVLKTLLTGERPDTFSEVHGAGDTWFQFEGAEWNPFHNPSDSFVHLLNYMQYKLTGRNVGPLGTSPHTDKNPIVIPYVAPSPAPNPTPTPPLPGPTPPVAAPNVPVAPTHIAPHAAVSVRVPRALVFGGAHNKSVHKARPSGSLQPHA